MTSRARQRGFTLAEAVMSAAIIGMISMGMVGALVVVSKAAPVNDTASRSRSLTSTVLGEMCTELRYAGTIRSLTATNIEFTVPDRDGDGDEEIIAYDWAGAGAPLMRTYNGDSSAVIPTLQSFALAATKSRTTVTQTVTGTASSGEVRLSYWNGWPLVLTPTSTQATLTASAWASSYFKIDQVTLPANMTRLELTKLRVKLKKSSSATGTTLSAGFYLPAIATKPQAGSTQVGTTATLPISSMTTSFVSYDFAFSGVTFSAAPAELVFVLKGSGTSAGFVNYYTSTLASTDTPVMLMSADTGATWTPTKNLQQNDILFEVWGTYEWPATTDLSTDYYNMLTLTVSLATSSAAADKASTTVRTVNKPSVPGP